MLYIPVLCVDVKKVMAIVVETGVPTLVTAPISVTVDDGTKLAVV